MKKIDKNYPYDVNLILECEFYMLEELNFHLIVYHPYRPLIHFLSALSMHDLLEYSWSVINDSYRTDLSLMYPPYIIALAAIYLTSNVKDKDLRQWFCELSIEMNEVGRVINELVAMYESWNNTAGDELKIAMDKLRNKWRRT